MLLKKSQKGHRKSATSSKHYNIIRDEMKLSTHVESHEFSLHAVYDGIAVSLGKLKKVKKKNPKSFSIIFYFYQRCKDGRCDKINPSTTRRVVLAVTLAYIALLWIAVQLLLYMLSIIINRVLPFPYRPQ